MVYCENRTWKLILPPSLASSASLFTYSSDHAECTHTLLSMNNKSNSSVAGKNQIVTTHRIKPELVTCQCTHLRYVTRGLKHPLLHTLQSDLSYIRSESIRLLCICFISYFGTSCTIPTTTEQVDCQRPQNMCDHLRLTVTRVSDRYHHLVIPVCLALGQGHGLFKIKTWPRQDK